MFSCSMDQGECDMSLPRITWASWFNAMVRYKFICDVAGDDLNLCVSSLLPMVTWVLVLGSREDCIITVLIWYMTCESPMVDTIRKEQWQNVVREALMGMTKSVNTMAVNEKVIHIYTYFNGVAIKE